MLVKIEQEGGIKSIKIAEASDGLNAYQLAVKNDGFVGDYDAWKVTLKGEAGSDANNVIYSNNAVSKSYKIGKQIGLIDDFVEGSIMVSGRIGYENKLGINNTKPTSEPISYARDIDTGYVSGVAEYAGILAGYDNVNNALAGIIASQHSMLYKGADHGTIIGGSLNTLKAGAEYSGIFSGTDNVIEELCTYAIIFGGERNKIQAGATSDERGFRSVILTSVLSIASGRNAVILGGLQSVINARYGTILNGEYITIENGDHVGVGGNTITAGDLASASYSFIWGLNHNVNASRSLCFGEGHTVGVNHDYSVSTGFRCITPFPGAKVHASRQRANVAGNNMSIEWSASNESTSATLKVLSVYGSSTYPLQPENSIINGSVLITGVDSVGECSTYKIEFTSQRIGTANPVFKSNVLTTLYNGLALPTPPTMNGTTGGIYRVFVYGKAATNISWQCSFTGHQIVYS